MFPKTFRVSDTVEWRLKIVPGEMNGVRERTLADLRATTRLNVLSCVGGSQTRPQLVEVDGTHHVGRIRRALSGVDWVNHGAQFDVHSTVDGQPVELDLGAKALARLSEREFLAQERAVFLLIIEWEFSKVKISKSERAKFEIGVISFNYLSLFLLFFKHISTH